MQIINTTHDGKFRQFGAKFALAILLLIAVVSLICFYGEKIKSAVSGYVNSHGSRSSSEVDGSTRITAGPPDRLFPESSKPVVRFIGSSRAVVDLYTNEWSQQIITPTHPTKIVDYRVDVEPPTGFLIKFQDGYIDEVRVDQSRVNDWSMRRGIFRILGTSSGQKATVTISYRFAR